MKLIFMQETINFMAKVNPESLEELSIYGTPEPVELLDDKGEVKTKYYLYKLTNNIVGS